MAGAALLEDPAVLKQVHRFTIEEYHRLGERGEIGERTELIEGVIINKMPKSPLHVYLIETIRVILEAILATEFIVRQEQPITIKALESEPEPDISVIRGRREDFLTGHPQTAELVVEVAVTSLSLDRAKLRGYALAGVRECWIIRTDTKAAEIYSNPQGDDYTTRSVVPLEGSLEVYGTHIALKSIFPQAD